MKRHRFLSREAFPGECWKQICPGKRSDKLPTWPPTLPASNRFAPFKPFGSMRFAGGKYLGLPWALFSGFSCFEQKKRSFHPKTLNSKDNAWKVVLVLVRTFPLISRRCPLISRRFPLIFRETTCQIMPIQDFRSFLFFRSKSETSKKCPEPQKVTKWKTQV